MQSVCVDENIVFVITSIPYSTHSFWSSGHMQITSQITARSRRKRKKRRRRITRRRKLDLTSSWTQGRPQGGRRWRRWRRKMTATATTKNIRVGLWERWVSVCKSLPDTEHICKNHLPFCQIEHRWRCFLMTNHSDWPRPFLVLVWTSVTNPLQSYNPQNKCTVKKWRSRVFFCDKAKMGQHVSGHQ